MFIPCTTYTLVCLVALNTAPIQLFMVNLNLGVGSFILVFITIFGLSYTGERITQKLRESYLRAILRQNVAFFDQIGSGEVATRISSDMNLIQVRP